MSWIDDDREIRKLKETANIIHANSMQDGCIIEGPQRVVDYISPYNFNTPIELTTMLQTYWRRLDKEYMNAFASVVTVAAFKNKDSQKNNYETISPLIYEF